MNERTVTKAPTLAEALAAANAAADGIEDADRKRLVKRYLRLASES